jgi:hypothetical protein
MELPRDKEKRRKGGQPFQRTCSWASPVHIVRSTSRWSVGLLADGKLNRTTPVSELFGKTDNAGRLFNCARPVFICPAILILLSLAANKPASSHTEMRQMFIKAIRRDLS